MLFAVLFEDNSEIGGDVRRDHMPAHLDFLTRNAAKIKAAGPLLSSAQHMEGGLWIVEAGNQAEVDELIKEDPFWPTGLRHAVRVLTWKQVFADGVPLV